MVSAQPPSHPTPFSSPFPGQESGISLYAKGDLFLFVHVGLRYGSQNYCPPFAWHTQGEKNADTKWAYLCLCWNMDFFVLSFVHGCVWHDRVGGGHAWIVTLFSSIVPSQQWSVHRTRKHLSLEQHIVYKKKRMTTCCVSLFHRVTTRSLGCGSTLTDSLRCTLF